MERKGIGSAVLVFIITYALFSLAGVLFPVDREWYESLNKPEWTPKSSFIGGVWSVLFGLISLSAAIVYTKYGFKHTAMTFWIMLIINYVFNQAFSYFQFTEKDLFASAVDSFLVALTALALAIISRKAGKTVSLLLVPYVLWSFFAAYLAYTIHLMNP
ncbi:TspO/MBR family protein [Bacillus swezeyi]|uniref:Tryptophan-rich sensory protein n=1 Tax=Bacillus swezeyi TaxID=1925020 RepID=A0A5M8RUA3_9BACI|nr:tryptophan-rich sensory protein [Bacillus swezeyi]KAA6450424.1 tryptophan-rich sensory protein [Bacillus swezeyi]KAA6475365.1 tryptophan-rich sensory protein [Bacillus swezeyi]TYS36963.1 tryptophan-rich sensory protein [Bacillus swezeyi]